MQLSKSKEFGGDCDINDAFDTIFLAEQRFTDEGHVNGFADTTSCLEEYERGCKLGVEMAAGIADEVGNHWVFATVWLAQLKTQRLTVQKKVKVLKELKEFGNKVVGSSTEDTQWEHVLETERAKYKQARSIFGLSAGQRTSKSQGMSF